MNTQECRQQQTMRGVAVAIYGIYWRARAHSTAATSVQAVRTTTGRNGSHFGANFLVWRAATAAHAQGLNYCRPIVGRLLLG